MSQARFPRLLPGRRLVTHLLLPALLLSECVSAFRRPPPMRLLSYDEIRVCPSQFDAHAPCESLIADFNSAAPSSPTVLILGPLSGNSAISATAAYNLVALLSLRSQADPWISRLLSTRRIIIVPIPAPATFSSSTESEVNPETDFPFARPRAAGPTATASQPCLRSFSAALVDALFRAHTLVVALAFQDARREDGEAPGDAVLFSWESQKLRACSRDWRGRLIAQNGSRVAECGDNALAPDDVALRSVARRMAAFAGPAHAARGGMPLAVGTVGEFAGKNGQDGKSETGLRRGHADGRERGGGRFLDYAYAASARGDLFDRSCAQEPTNVSHAAASFVVRVDAVQEDKGGREGVAGDDGRAHGAWQHLPDEKWGRLSALYQHEPRGNIITRVLRAALVGVDMAAPYVFWLNADEDEPVQARGGIAHVRWSVGGSVSVAQTWLTCRLGDSDAEEWNTSVQTGGSMWSQSFDDARGLTFFRLHKLAAASYEFRESLQLYLRLTPRQRSHGTSLHIRAEAVVDTNWSPPSSHPLTHLVQLRSNNSWVAVDSDGQPLYGQRVVATDTLTVEVPPVSGFAAFLHFVWEFLLIAAVLFVGPPVCILLCIRRSGFGDVGAGGLRAGELSARATSLVRQRLRRTWRNVSRGEFIGEVARARGPRQRFARNVSLTNLLGVLKPSSDENTVPKQN